MKTNPVASERFWSWARSRGGWGKPNRARRWHFFERGLHARLCHQFDRFECPPIVQDDAPSPTDRCSACVDQLACEFLRWNAAAPIYLLTLRRQSPCPCCGAPVEWWTRPPGLIWLPPITPVPGEAWQRGGQVWLDTADMESLPFHRSTCPDGYLYRDRKPWVARIEDEAVERYERRQDP